MQHNSITKPEPFVTDSLIIVEGADEAELFEFIARSRQISCPRIWRLNGRGSLKKALQAIKVNSGIENLKTIGLVLDSEDNTAETQRLSKLFSDFVFYSSKNPQLNYLQLPSVMQTGSIERICLNSISSSDPLLACSQQFIECLQTHPHALSTQALKDSAQLLAWYMAKSGKPISRIGFSTRSDLKLDAHHKAFDTITEFIISVANHV